MLETVVQYWDAVPEWVHAITAVVTAASAVVVLTPTKTDDKILASVLKVLNFLALNIKKK